VSGEHGHVIIEQKHKGFRKFIYQNAEIWHYSEYTETLMQKSTLKEGTTPAKTDRTAKERTEIQGSEL
jgi:hypothetical protein